MRYQSAWIRTSDITRALESKRETRRSSVTEDASDPSEVDRELRLDPDLARRPPAEVGGRAEIQLGWLGIDQGVELTQGAPVAAPVMGQVGGHDVRPPQQVGDAQQATVDAVLPGVGVLFLGVVVRGDAELRDLGDAVDVQHRLLAGEGPSDRPGHKPRLLRADVLLQRAQLWHS